MGPPRKAWPSKLRCPSKFQRLLQAGFPPTRAHQHTNVTSEYVPERANSAATEVVDAAWPLAGTTALSVGKGARHYCGGPILSWVTVLPDPDPTLEV